MYNFLLSFLLFFFSNFIISSNMSWNKKDELDNEI